MFRHRPFLRRAAALAALAAVGVTAGCLPEPRPTNHGQFTGEALPGSFLELVDGNGAPIPASNVDFGRPACGDGKDNDVDGLADAADPACVGRADANERLPGLQEVVPTTLPVRVKPNGVVTVRPSDLVVQQREVCLDLGTGEPWCTGITLRGAGPARRGSITRDTLTLPIPITIEMVGLSGFPTPLGPDCVIPYIDSVFTGSYDEDTGVAELSVSDVSVERAPDCGAWTEAINGTLGLPTTGRSALVVSLRNDAGDPVRFE
jgi:hypothetical protein